MVGERRNATVGKTSKDRKPSHNGDERAAERRHGSVHTEWIRDVEFVGGVYKLPRCAHGHRSLDPAEGHPQTAEAL